MNGCEVLLEILFFVSGIIALVALELSFSFVDKANMLCHVNNFLSALGT